MTSQRKTSDPKAELRRAIQLAYDVKAPTVVLTIPQATRLEQSIEAQGRTIGQLETRIHEMSTSVTGRTPLGDERGLLALEVRIDPAGVILDKTFARFPRAIEGEATELTTTFLRSLVALVEGSRSSEVG